MNVVEILEKCCLIEITVEYCRKKLLCFFFTFRKVIQNSLAYRPLCEIEAGKFLIFRRQVSLGCCIPKIIKHFLRSVIQKIQKGTFLRDIVEVNG